MNTDNWWLVVLFIFLAGFRLTILISQDDAPFGLARKLRLFLKREAKTNQAVKVSEVDRGISCPRCSGYWVAIMLTIYCFYHSSMPLWASMFGNGVIIASAISGAIIILNRAFSPK